MTEKELDILIKEAESAAEPEFSGFLRVSEANTLRVLDAFREYRLSASHFASSDGYGYNDRGREIADAIYAKVFCTESAVVRHSIANGTHALTIALFGLLRPGDTLLSVTGELYDTLSSVTEKHNGDGSLADFGIRFGKLEFTRDAETGKETFDYPALLSELKTDKSIKAVYVQRSKGYAARRTLSAEEINRLADFVHANSGAYVITDNCYGEFTGISEPSHADLIVGSLIKNPGGGMADCGAYFAGTERAVTLAANRMTVPGIGGEVGATLGQNRNIIRGLFFAPHIVAEALKTACFASHLFSRMGYGVSPLPGEERYDIIQLIELETPEKLCAFCRGLQAASPVDSFLTPEPWDMPGYDDKVIMAAGAFVGGSSIELSADGPLRPPYRVYMQGGLTYESGKAGVISAARFVLGLDGQ